MSRDMPSKTHTHTHKYIHATIHTMSPGSSSFCPSIYTNTWKPIGAEMLTKPLFLLVLPLQEVFGLTSNEDTASLVCSLFLRSSFYKEGERERKRERGRERESSLRMHRSQLSPVSTLFAQQPIPLCHHEYFISSARRLKTHACALPHRGQKLLEGIQMVTR